MSSPAFRIEHDLLGDREVPAEVYYGVHTLRAVENFPITGTAISIYPELIKALACVKQAAAHPPLKPAISEAHAAASPAQDGLVAGSQPIVQANSFESRFSGFK